MGVAFAFLVLRPFDGFADIAAQNKLTANTFMACDTAFRTTGLPIRLIIVRTVVATSQSPAFSYTMTLPISINAQVEALTSVEPDCSSCRP